MPRRKLRLVWAVLAGIGLAACNLVQSPATPNADELATRVSGTLTAIPPGIALPTALEPATPTAIPVPSATDLPAASPTPSPSPTASATSSPSPSPTPVASATSPAGDPRASLGNPTWRDEFSSGQNWPLGEDDFTRADVANGELVLTGLSTTYGWRLSWPVVQDFYLEMTARTGSCAGSDEYGLIVRVPDLDAANAGYLFGVTCDGRYAIRAWDGKTMSNLIRLTAGAGILTGPEQVNRVGVWADGDRFILYINGAKLAEVGDSTFSEEGSFGIFIGARQTDNFTLRVNEIAYWESP